MNQNIRIRIDRVVFQLRPMPFADRIAARESLLAYHETADLNAGWKATHLLVGRSVESCHMDGKYVFLQKDLDGWLTEESVERLTTDLESSVLNRLLHVLHEFMYWITDEITDKNDQPFEGIEVLPPSNAFN